MRPPTELVVAGGILVTTLVSWALLAIRAPSPVKSEDKKKG